MLTRAVKPTSGPVSPTCNTAKWIFAYHRNRSSFAKVFHLLCLGIIHIGFSILVLGCQAQAQAQTLEARITARIVAPAKLQIDLVFPAETDVLSFRNSYG